MAVELKVPSVGESITEGTLARWLKPDGAAVQANEPVFELETDKASQEVAAPAAGVLRHGRRPRATKVSVGQVVGANRAERPGRLNGDPASRQGERGRADSAASAEAANTARPRPRPRPLPRRPTRKSSSPRRRGSSRPIRASTRTHSPGPAATAGLSKRTS